MASRRLLRQTDNQRSRVARPTAQETRRFKSTVRSMLLQLTLISQLIAKQILLEAKKGGLQELQHLVDGIHTLDESLIPDVFEAFFEHLEASKVPSV